MSNYLTSVSLLIRVLLIVFTMILCLVELPKEWAFKYALLPEECKEEDDS